MTAREVVLIIPAFNEVGTIAAVVEAALPHVSCVIVGDNGSTDGTADAARAAGALVASAPSRGYGRACMAGAAMAPHADIYVFLDGDGSDDPSEIPQVIAPILEGEADLVIGSRVLGAAEPGALTLPQRFGNRLAAFLMKRLWNAPFSDLGPFRAIRREAYEQLGMDAPTFGWTVQMQVRAVKAGLACRETPVSRRNRRAGVSKITGTARGVVLAGAHILGCIALEAARRPRR